ncbi:T9SS type A sorting domain-containing protein [Paludibacteraceae bacterium OttesenSCG-928-F17]|nr:T9SS type A sorting domain-containing protein [Paludibacteraceae bacterium OttesenSCG-928-F17]
MRKLLFFVFLLIYSFSILIHGQIGMGQWRPHFSYNSVVNITQSDNNVFAIANGALFSVNKDDQSIISYNKIDGLSDNVISYIEFDNTNNQLLIGYSNGNIDLLAGNGIYNIPDYKNSNLSIDKNINHITVYNNKAYLSCNFGILVLNLKKKEIAESYYIGDNAVEVVVLSTTIRNNNIYASTYRDVQVGRDTIRKHEIYQASLSNPNLIDFQNWSTLENLPGKNSIQGLETFNNTLFMLRDSILYYQNDETWEVFKNISAYNISSSNDKLIVNIGNQQAAFIDKDFNITYKSNVYSFAEAIYDDKKSIYWFAGGYVGLFSYGYGSEKMNYFLPEGPVLNTCWDLAFSGGRLYVVPGGREAVVFSWPANVMIYENNRWKNLDLNYLNNYDPEIKSDTAARDFVAITVDPKDKTHFIVNSYGAGVFEFRNDELVNLYNAANTPEVESAIPTDPAFAFTDGGVFDENGNFWFTNSQVSYGVKVLTPQGKVIKISCDGINGNPTVGKIYINQLAPNHKWVFAPRGNSRIGFLDDNGTVEYTGDDRSKWLTSFNNSDPNKQGEKISPEKFYCLAQEKNGTMWVGTSIGPLLFQRPQDVFSDSFAATQIKIPRNDGTTNADLLLASEHVKAIAIDAANRKWLGTLSSGVYLVSENGQETIHHFTAENSPLLSNNIFSIAINPASGEVFFATANGLISYLADAAEAENEFKNVHVYPNPVRENFEGPITITGLTENTQVKITDASGNLICETRSNGSIATWNGKNANGRRVATGVYLALCVSEDGKQSTIAKILVVN